ncbi:MAG: ribosome silencing factor [Betaproteobacteria bacterium]|nr:ribosome silencing factor [Betaproteobacteria bacterium]
MDIRKLQRIIVGALEDVKAQDIQVFNTETLTSLFDRVIVASGSSNRQTRALAATVRDKVREAGGTVKNPEGAESGEWVLVDCGDAVVHIMQPAIRAYYKLEDIWGGKSVHLKVRQPPEAQPGVRRAGDGAAAKSAGKAPASKTPARKSPASKAPAKRAASSAVDEAPARASRAPARKSTAPRAGASGAGRSAAAPAAKRAGPAAKTSAKSAETSAVKSAAPSAAARARRPAAKATAGTAAPRRAATSRAKPKA